MGDVRAKALVSLAVILGLTGQLGAAWGADPGGPPIVWIDGLRDQKPIAINPAEGGIALGRQQVRWDKVSLAALARRSGTSVRRRGDASASTRWICFHLDGQTGSDARLWLTSDVMANDDNIDGAVLAKTAATAPDNECPALPSDLAPIRLPHGVRLGMDDRALADRFGAPSATRGETKSYVYWRQVQGPPPGPWTLGGSMWVRLENGRVSALFLGETVSN